MLSPEDVGETVECCAACGHCAPLLDEPRTELPAGLPDEAYCLGKPSAVYSGNRYGPLQRLLETTIVRGLLILAVVWLVQQFAAAIAANNFQFDGWQLAGLGAIALPVVCAIGLFIDGWHSVFLHTAAVFADRFVAVTKEGKAIFFTLRWGQLFERPRHVLHFPWDEIDGVTQDVLIYSELDGPRIQHVMTLRRSDGTQAFFKAGFACPEPNLVRIIETVQGTMTARLLPGALQRYRDGGTLEFGAACINQEGLGLEGETIPWSDVDEMDVKKGSFEVRRRGGAQVVLKVGRIENLFVFLSVLREGAGRTAPIQSLVPWPEDATPLPIGRATTTRTVRMTALATGLLIAYVFIFYIGPLLRW